MGPEIALSMLEPNGLWFADSSPIFLIGRYSTGYDFYFYSKFKIQLFQRETLVSPLLCHAHKQQIVHFKK